MQKSLSWSWVAIGAVALLAVCLFSVQSAFAAAVVTPACNLADDTTFDTFTAGSVNGQHGWSSTGSYDQAVVSNTYGYPTFGCKSLRISNAVTSGSFGDQTFSYSVANEAGETVAQSGGFSSGTRQNHFEAQFDLGTVSSTSLQSGLTMSVSPDRGDGARMSYLRFEDQADGIHAFFDDVTDPTGVVDADAFNETDIATLDRTMPHTIKFVMDFINGPHNDVVKVYIDGVLKATGTSWEDYYRYDTESNPSAPSDTSRTVDSLLFREGGTATPANSGKGFLVDNVSLTSSTATPPPATVTVTIDKFINGSMATAGSAAGSSFPMQSSWNAQNLGGAGSGTYSLAPAGFNSPNAYEAITSDMTSGSSYSTNEDTSGSVVGATCQDGKPYALNGYSVGDTLQAAQAAATTTQSPALTNITSNKYVIVWNKTCQAPVVVPTPVHVYPANNSTLTTATWDKADWTDVSDAYMPMTYRYESSNASTTNPDGSFTTPAYQSGVLSVSEIPTTGTPAGVWYWHVRAVDNNGAMSPWTTAWKVTVDNTPPANPVPPANACATPGTAPAGYTLRQGSSGNDTVTLAPNTMFVGKGGNDRVSGGDGNYIVCTGGGNDIIGLGNGNSTIDAGGGNNDVTLGNGQGAIMTGSGNDTVVAGDGARTIDVGGGNNKVTTGDGAQSITAGSGNDEIRAGGGDDTVQAGGGNNKLWGEAGTDMLTSAAGNDQLDGGAGTDTCQAGGGVNTKTSCEL